MYRLNLKVKVSTPTIVAISETAVEVANVDPTVAKAPKEKGTSGKPTDQLEYPLESPAEGWAPRQQGHSKMNKGWPGKKACGYCKYLVPLTQWAETKKELLKGDCPAIWSSKTYEDLVCCNFKEGEFKHLLCLKYAKKRWVPQPQVFSEKGRRTRKGTLEKWPR